MNLETILDALASVLDNVAGVTCSARPPDVEQLPQAFVSDIIVTPNRDFEGDFDILVEVTWLLSPADAEAAWDKAVALFGSGASTSIYGVLAAAPTLGAAVSSCSLVRLHGFRYDVEYAGVPYFGGTAEISIYA